VDQVTRDATAAALLSASPKTALPALAALPGINQETPICVNRSRGVIRYNGTGRDHGPNWKVHDEGVPEISR
jgi:hypothetical protein